MGRPRTCQSTTMPLVVVMQRNLLRTKVVKAMPWTEACQHGKASLGRVGRPPQIGALRPHRHLRFPANT
jgi:hypothetical protein